MISNSLTLIAGTVYLALVAMGTCQTDAVDLWSKIQNKAASVQAEPISKLLLACQQRDRKDIPGLNESQIHLATRLDGLVRRVKAAWLLNGLTANPTPPDGELQARLGERGADTFAVLASHADAITAEIILTRDQSQRWFRNNGQSPPRLLGGRYPRIRQESPYGLLSNKASYQHAINSWMATLAKPVPQATDLFVVLLDPVKSKPIGLSQGQQEQIRELESLVRDVSIVWLGRAVEGVPIPTPEEAGDPPSPAMIERMSGPGLLLGASVVAHAEAIALDGILTPTQVEVAKRISWNSRGINSLLDPDMVSRLKLSRKQQDTLLDRLNEHADLDNRVRNRLITIQSDLMDRARGGFAHMPDTTAVITEAQRVVLEKEQNALAQREIDKSNAKVLKVLHPEQLATFRSVVSTLNEELFSNPDQTQPSTKPSGK